MAYVYKARKRLLIGGSIVNPGDVITPTAWRHLPAWVHNGSVVLVQTAVTENFKPKQRIPVSPGMNDWKLRTYKRFDPQQLRGWD